MCTSSKLKITVYGKPKGKDRPRVCKNGHTFTPKATREYERLVRKTFQSKYPDWVPTSEPVKLEIRAYFPIPKSWSKKKQKQAEEEAIPCMVKPDLDNIGKIIDALNGIAFVDDKQIVEEHLVKQYSTNPRVEFVFQI